MPDTPAARCRLLAALGGGAHGLRYAAIDPEGDEVEAWLVEVPALEREPFARRLRTLALCDHPAILAVQQFRLDETPVEIIVDRGSQITLAADTAWKPIVPTPAALALAAHLAGGLAEAHRVGAAAGGFDLQRVVRASGDTANVAASDIREAQHALAHTIGQWRLDLTGLDVQPAAPAEAPASAFLPMVTAERRAQDPAGDIYSLGALLVWLITGQPACPHDGEHYARQLLGESVPAESTVGPAASKLARMLERMLAAEAAQRPTAAWVQSQLGELLRTETATLDGPASSADSLQLSLGGLEAVDPLISGSQVGAASPPVGEPTAGGKLGRYQLVEKLGQGGMGMVFRAVDPVDGREVAIKLLRTPGTSGEPPVRFLKEARLLAEVHNPFVANLLEVNCDAGVHYLVLEYIRGESLGLAGSARPAR